MPEIGKTIAQGELLKTGQTTQYDGYSDDGYYRKGLPKAYNILTAGQFAGTTSITLYNKTDLISNNCVADLRTKLMWSRYPSDGLGPNSNGRLPFTTNSNGEGIFAFVAAANVAKLAGYSDWRIPNLIELLSIISFEKTSGAPDATAFPGWPVTEAMITSTTAKILTTYVLSFQFAQGLPQVGLKTNLYFVSLVRGG
jgi:hypothetical protein